MRTFEIFGKGKHEYAVTGTFSIDNGPIPLNLAQVTSRVQEVYSLHPWIDSDQPTDPKAVSVTATRISPSGKHGLFEAMFGDSGYILVKMHLERCLLRQSQLRSFEKCVAVIESELWQHYGFQLMRSGVETWKVVGRTTD